MPGRTEPRPLPCPGGTNGVARSAGRGGTVVATLVRDRGIGGEPVDEIEFNCERCGRDRDTFLPGYAAFRTCPTCDALCCPDCWNQFERGCVLCQPFRLPDGRPYERVRPGAGGTGSPADALPHVDEDAPISSVQAARQGRVDGGAARVASAEIAPRLPAGAAVPPVVPAAATARRRPLRGPSPAGAARAIVRAGMFALAVVAGLGIAGVTSAMLLHPASAPVAEAPVATSTPPATPAPRPSVIPTRAPTPAPTPRVTSRPTAAPRVVSPPVRATPRPTPKPVRIAPPPPPPPPPSTPTPSLSTEGPEVPTAPPTP